MDCIDSPQARNNRIRRISNEPETREPASATFQRGGSDFFPVLAEGSFVGDAILSHSADIRFGDASDVDLSVDCWGNWDTSHQSPPGGIQSPGLMSSRRTSLPRTNPSDSLRARHTLQTTGDYAGRNTEYGDHRTNENGGDSQGHLSQPNPSALDSGHIEMDFSMELEMNQLLALTHSLYMQQKKLESAPWAKYLSSLSFTAGQKLAHGGDGAGKAIGEILSNSELFLKIITRFLALTENRESSSRREKADFWTSADVSLQEVESNGNRGGWKANSERPNSSFQQNSASSTSVADFLSLPTEPPTPDQLDTPTILLVLNCYNRLLFIYATLFSHIKQYLSSSSPTASSNKVSNLGTNSNPEPLHIGGFSLGSYGDIQIKVLVDISVHFITRIQQALGVPLNHTLMGADTTESMELCDSPGTDGGLSEIPQMRMLLETFIKTVGMDGHERTQERGCGFTELKKEFKELQRLHRWKL